MTDTTEDDHRPTKIPSLSHAVSGNSQMVRDLHKIRKIMLLTLLPTPSGLPPLGSTQRRKSSSSTKDITAKDKQNISTQEHTSQNSTKHQKPLDHCKSVEMKGAHVWSPQPSTSKGVTSQSSRRNSSHVLVRTKTGKTRSKSEVVPPGRVLEESFNGLANFALEQAENSLDLLTLSSIHSEFKSKLFGEEWTNRERKSSCSRRLDLEATEAPKPRRLTPLRIETPIRRNSYTIQSNKHNNKPIVSGLHLSANYNNSMPDGFSESFAPAQRKRKNSLDELGKQNNAIANEASYDRPNSAPHRGRDASPNKSSNDTRSPPRVNTPTEVYSSSKIHKPQLMGLSFATNSPEESLNIPGSQIDRSKTYIRSPTPLPAPDIISLTKSLNRTGTGNKMRLGPLRYKAQKLCNEEDTLNELRPFSRSSVILSANSKRKTSLS